MAISKSNTIKQGDSFVLNIKPLDENGDPYDLTAGTWTCDVGVYDCKGSEKLKVSYNNLNGANDTFVAFFTPAQTLSMLPGIYTLAAQVDRTDSTPPLSIEVHDKLEVKHSLIG